MNYKVIIFPAFGRQLKRLAKKYPSLKTEITELILSLKQEPHQGTPIGSDCFKIRIPIASKGKGKSGGGRVITHVHFSGETVILISIYDKSEISAISDATIKEYLKAIYN